MGKREDKKMSILISRKTKVLIQGITGHQGTLQTKIMKEYGTQIVAGVTPKKGGTTIEGIPVYNSVKEACKEHKPQWSIIFVPREHTKQAAEEALQNNLNIVIITEHIPTHDVLKIKEKAKKKNKIMIGPNSPGIINPEQTKLGIMPQEFFKKGPIGVLSRSGTLTYEITNYLTEAELGQSTVMGIGGDAINGFSFIDGLKEFAKDKETEAIVLIGEIGGIGEEDTAQFLRETDYQKKYKKPIITYIAGKTAPVGKNLGHAGALISRGKGSAATKITALRREGVLCAKSPQDIPNIVRKCLKKRENLSEKPQIFQEKHKNPKILREKLKIIRMF
jgi:succinyl-CoA synthetase alpha subunit